MKWYETRCPWCSKSYSTSGRYSNHIAKAHPEKDVQSRRAFRQRRLSDSETELDIDILTNRLADRLVGIGNADRTLESDINTTLPGISSLNSDTESEDEGSDREAREFENGSESEDAVSEPGSENESSDPGSDDDSSDRKAQGSESDVEGRQTNVVVQVLAGTPIRGYPFPERDPSYNLYAPFRHGADYQLAHFFNTAKTSQGNIDKFFRGGVLKALNPTHHVQFRSAYTMYKILDTGADEPRWQKGKVNYPLQNGVKFRYRNILSALKYLLRQKAYVDSMLWGPHKEYDQDGDRVYSEINTAT